MRGYVVDASVLVEIFVRGDFADQCVTLLDAASTSSVHLHAPDAIYYEVAAALRKHEMRGEYSTIGEDIAILADLDIRITPTKDLLFDGIQIARTHAISTYDSFYIAEAERTGLTLLTVDRRLANGVRNKPFRVLHISDFV